jgi:protein dithiol:quinone oxidoreductase
MSSLLSRRWVNAVGFLACAALLGYAYVLQFVDGLAPCPLCILQRVGFVALGLLFLAAAIHHPGVTGARIYGGLIAIAAAAGAAIAGRHVWLQSLPPDRVPECGPGLEYMLSAFPLSETLTMVLTGSGECAAVSWSFLGLTIPAWALLWFVVLGLAGLARNVAAVRS